MVSVSTKRKYWHLPNLASTGASRLGPVEVTQIFIYSSLLSIGSRLKGIPETLPQSLLILYDRYHPENRGERHTWTPDHNRSFLHEGNLLPL